MRILFALMMLTALGCGASAPKAIHGPHLGYVDTALDEENYPLAFTLHVVNDGDEAVSVDRVRFQVVYKTLLYDDEITPPSGFDFRVVTYDKPSADGSSKPSSEPIVVPPGSTRNISGLITWELTPDPPAMMAIVRARFLPMRGDAELLDQEPLVMLLQSRPGAARTSLKVWNPLKHPLS